MADLAMDERLLLVECFIGLSIECGESIEDARTAAKTEVDRLVAKDDVVAVSRLKARAKLQDLKRAELAATTHASGTGSSSRTAQMQDDLEAKDNKRFEFQIISEIQMDSNDPLILSPLFHFIKCWLAWKTVLVHFKMTQPLHIFLFLFQAASASACYHWLYQLFAEAHQGC